MESLPVLEERSRILSCVVYSLETHVGGLWLMFGLSSWDKRPLGADMESLGVVCQTQLPTSITPTTFDTIAWSSDVTDEFSPVRRVRCTLTFPGVLTVLIKSSSPSSPSVAHWIRPVIIALHPPIVDSDGSLI